MDNTKKKKYEYHVLQVYHVFRSLSLTTPSMGCYNQLVIFILDPTSTQQHIPSMPARESQAEG